ncbi:hypothetical protein J8869_00985 [Bacteroides uniformis]|uniref:hypothetical protein n=1 Tax=Bacteroides uniformis TaxID=820 RepID=UPI001F191289|nr:hypothetical protein [Bacteroides uniformis]MCE8480904.1 hypothetical protein [Bacteroides uniformis]
MSWDEKDWAYTWFTGKRCRLNLLFRDFNITDIEEDEKEVNYTIREYDRNVYEFSIMSKEEMDQLAKVYGIMIEYQYLGNYRYCFDYRNKECIFERINLKQSGFSSSLNIHSYMYILKPLDVNMFREDLKKLEAFIEYYNEKIFYNKINIEKKIMIEQARNIIKSLKQDISTFNNIDFKLNNYSFAKISGEYSRLNLLFGKDTILFRDLEEVEAVFYIKDSDIKKKSEEEFLYIRKIAETYGLCIKLSHHCYDFRQNKCISNNLKVEGLSPLSNIYIGEYIASFSTYEL